MDGIKKRLEDAKGRWVEELLSVLWTYQTTPRRSTRETPFALDYGMEVVIPLEIGLPTLRTELAENSSNDAVILRDLDLAEEKREQASIRMASYQNQIARAYNKNVKPRSFSPRNLVLRRVLGSAKDPAHGKLGANWEGPYRIARVGGSGYYELETLDERAVPRPWNTSSTLR